MVWSSINTDGVILTPQFLLCTCREHTQKIVGARLHLRLLYIFLVRAFDANKLRVNPPIYLILAFSFIFNQPDSNQKFYQPMHRSNIRLANRTLLRISDRSVVSPVLFLSLSIKFSAWLFMFTLLTKRRNNIFSFNLKLVLRIVSICVVHHVIQFIFLRDAIQPNPADCPPPPQKKKKKKKITTGLSASITFKIMNQSKYALFRTLKL